ncbi:adaptor protein MecA [Vagococcus lutrae]|uniref:Adapter protein MecA n=2 Tax=Vagococcus lutrae TaxID=81947 RepID=V6Q6G1_9ENTE|nr:adaptor protein MecA [Vagococcus lutrae]EST90709.1 hypothetical protein T233_00147 [Vagococcus lutrae LBD1]MCO7151567.1 adaptor protein MecA [Vagococcus lutrae]MDT2801975.1 adaptor protein MecA [Vagococcus lutrae]MDT2806482.1 adaptor protein MecA [Vagococcus lutrae]MDT2812905.1 adaptor protein MecA [Vagococcus lutrae]
MEMERINENTIRVLIENEDLEERGITFLDLLGNHKQIEEFFHSILEEVDIDEQFQETDAVTFQVMPNRNGLELFISKNLMSSDGEGLPDITDLINQGAFGDLIQDKVAQTPLEDKSIEVEEAPQVHYVIAFRSLEEAIQLAKTQRFQSASTDLYQYQQQYFLNVTFYVEELTHKMMEIELGRMLEYGKLASISPELLIEHGQLIMEKSALEQLSYYFK